MPKPKSPIDRPHRLNMLLSDEERDLVFRLAEHERVEVSTYVRGLIYGEASRKLGWRRTATTKSKGAKR